MTELYNDEERKKWVLNDESLYAAWLADDPKEKHLTRWVKEHRRKIDTLIRHTLHPETIVADALKGEIGGL